MAEVVSGNLGDGRLNVVASDARELLDVGVLGNVERVIATDGSARVLVLEVADGRLSLSALLLTALV